MLTLDTKDTLLIKSFTENRDYVNAGARVIALTELGWTRKEIAHSLQVTPVTLRSWANAAKNTNTHAIFDNLTSKNQILSRTTNYTNHTQVTSHRRFHPKQTALLKDLHTSTKRTRSWSHYKNLLTYLLYLRYPISQISQTLQTSNSHITSLTIPNPSPQDIDFSSPLIQDFHQASLDPLTSKSRAHLIQTSPTQYHIITFPSSPPSQTKRLTLTKLLPAPHTTILYTSQQFSLLSPSLNLEMFPQLPIQDPSGDIIELDTPYIISHQRAVQELGIINSFKNTKKKETLTK